MGPGVLDPVLGLAVVADRAAGERAVAEPAGAAAGVARQEAVPTCGIPVYPEEAAAEA